MSNTKGPLLEELVRAYFSKQGFFALRSVPFRFDGEDVTDIDVWLYSRQTVSARIRGIVDVKNKKSPKAYERVLWVKGLQSALNCDKAIIATTDASPALVKFAHQQKIPVLSKGFLDRLEKKLSHEERLSLEQFNELIQLYPANKQDGDWLRVLSDAKSAVASLGGFPAFNKTMLAFRFFSERAEVRAQYREQATRCALAAAALACIALDTALESLVFEDMNRRYSGIMAGVTYGESGDGRIKQSLDVALSVISEGMQNGKAVAAQARAELERRLSVVRSDVIAEFFTREHNAQTLFSVAKELDDVSHSTLRLDKWILSVESRSILGVFSDFVGVKRSALPIGASIAVAESSVKISDATVNANDAEKNTDGQQKLI